VARRGTSLEIFWVCGVLVTMVLSRILPGMVQGVRDTPGGDPLPVALVFIVLLFFYSVWLTASIWVCSRNSVGGYQVLAKVAAVWFGLNTIYLAYSKIIGIWAWNRYIEVGPTDALRRG
jgi:hypothetical protein